MKKFMSWLFAVSLAVFVIDWGVVGVKLLNGDYDITVGAYIGLACCIIMLVCALYRCLSNKCPHCGKVRVTGGDYCSYCGKKIKF